MPATVAASTVFPFIQHPHTMRYATLLGNAKRWQDVQARIEALPSPQEKGTAFEAIMAALLVSDPSKQIRQAWFPAGQAPSDIWQRLKLPVTRGDKGLDGLAIDVNGQTIALQFKFRSGTDNALNWSEDKLSNFFGMSNQADVAWLVTNVDSVGDLGERHHHGIMTLLPDLQKISAAQFRDAHAWMTGQAVTFTRKTERLDQLRALDAIDQAFRGEMVRTYASGYETATIGEDEAMGDGFDEMDTSDLDDDPLDSQEVVGSDGPTAMAHNRVTVVSACGTGKTLIAERAVERSIHSGGQNFVVFVPSISLIGQTVDAWTREWAGDPILKDRMRYLAVCSDETVGDTGDDRSVMRVKDLGIPSVTTSVEDLQRFLSASSSADDVRVVFATYQSSAVVQEAVRSLQSTTPDWSFDLGVLDEAHKTAIRASGKDAKNQMFSRALHDEAIPIRQRVFMTATPRVRRVASKDGENAGVAYSMDNTDLYGPIVHRYSFHEAVQDKVIVPYKVVVSMVSHDEAARVTVRGLTGQEQQIPLEEAANLLAVAKAIQTTGAKRVLTFHGSIKDAEQFVADEHGIGGMLTQMGDENDDTTLLNWDVQSIKGTDSMARRESILHGLRENVRSLRSNARVLIEGLDVPAVDMVAFLGRQASPTDIVQAVGRAARAHAGKIEGYVVVPVVYSNHKNMDNALIEVQDRDDGMGTLFTMLSALMDHDQDLAQVINDLQTARVSGNLKAIEQATKMFGQRVGIVGHSSQKDAILYDDPMQMELQDLSDRMTQRVVERLADPFSVGIGYLKTFIENEGHARVPSRYEINNFNLGQWLSTRRKEIKSKPPRITTEHINQLNSLGISWDPFEEDFKNGISYLKDFVAREGHANVPQRHKERDFNLGVWLNDKRQAYKNLSARITPSRLEQLVELGVAFDIYDENFKIGISHLKSFIIREGHAMVPQRHKENNFNLGSWLNSRRVEYKNNSIRMNTKMVKQLLDLGVELNLVDKSFKIGIHYLNKFIAREGHAIVPFSHKEEGFNLGTWLGSRRQEFKNKAPGLTCEKIQQLSALGISLDRGNLDEIFQIGLNQLKVFVNREGHSRVPYEHKENNFNLGAWLGSLRQKIKNEPTKLHPDKIKQLATLGVDLERGYYDEDFNIGVLNLVKFVELNGSANIPVKLLFNEFKLGSWISSRRKEYKDGKLSDDRLEKLNSIHSSWTGDRLSNNNNYSRSPVCEDDDLIDMSDYTQRQYLKIKTNRLR